MSIAENNSSVEIRYIGIRFKESEIPSLCFCHNTQKDAISFFNVIHDYIMSSSGKSFYLNFSSENKYYNLKLTILTHNYATETVIKRISHEIIHGLVQGINKFRYFVILAGYTDSNGNFTLLSPGEYHMFKANISIDDKEYFGSKDDKIDWGEVLSFLKKID